MTYDEIFNRFYNLMDDPNFYKLPQDFAYDRMRSWLHDAASKPYIKKKFSQLKLDDRLLELTYSLNNPSDQESDDDFVINIFAQYMVIGWLKPQVDNAINTARIIGSKEEKNEITDEFIPYLAKSSWSCYVKNNRHEDPDEIEVTDNTDLITWLEQKESNKIKIKIADNKEYLTKILVIKCSINKDGRNIVGEIQLQISSVL